MGDLSSLSLGAQYYTKLIEQISLEAQKQQQNLKDLSSSETFLRSDLEQATEKARILCEIIILLKNITPYLNQVFGEIAVEDLQKSLQKQIVDFVDDLGELWGKEIKQDMEKKATRFLQQIGEKEEAIKKAIQERQEEIEALALKAIKKAETAQKGIK